MKKNKSVSAPPVKEPTQYELYCELMQTRAGLMTLNEIAAMFRASITEVANYARLKEIKANVEARKAKIKKK